MTREPGARPAAATATGPAGNQPTPARSGASGASGSIFSKGERQGGDAASGEQRDGEPAAQGGGGGQ
jgi:hypothetical protein